MANGTRVCGTVVAQCKDCTVAVRRTFYYLDSDQHKNAVKCDCGGDLEWRHEGYRKHNVFPYEHPHLTGDGKSVVVESLAHLRRLERQHGVAVHAFSQDSEDSPKQLPTFRPNGRDWREQ